MIKIKHVLLIDDDEIASIHNRILIEGMNIAEQVVSVCDGMEAIQFIKKKYVNIPNQQHRHSEKDLVFLDLKMPIMNGFEFLNEVQKNKDVYLRNLNIVVLTSSKQKNDIRDVVSYGDLVHSYVLKPLGEESVIEVLESIKKV